MNVTVVFRMVVDLWKLYQKYAGRCLGDQEMQKFREESLRVYEKYGRTKFCKELLLAVANEIERNVRHFEKEEYRC